MQCTSQHHPTDDSTFDVLIVGAGLVGSSLALALAHLPLRIGIVESRPELTTLLPSERPPCLEDSLPAAGGVISLNQVSQQLLTAIGVWELLAAESQTIQQIRISERGRFGKLYLSEEDRPLGYILPRQSLIAGLQTKLAHTIVSAKTLAQFHLYAGAKIQSIQRRAGTWMLHLPTNLLTTRLLIAADGHDSHVRRALAIPSKMTPSRDAALTVWVQRDREHHAIAYERFTSQGTLALLPYLGRSMGLVWTADSEYIEKLQHLDKTVFLDQAHTLLGPRFGRLSLLSERACRPIYCAPPDPISLPGVIALGDAAYRLHPIAAQGLNASFQDMITLVDLIKCVGSIKPSNETMPLEIDVQRYWDLSLPRQRKHWRVIEGIRNLFQTSSCTVGFARSVGLGITDGIPFLKKALIRHFSGDIL